MQEQAQSTEETCTVLLLIVASSCDALPGRAVSKYMAEPLNCLLCSFAQRFLFQSSTLTLHQSMLRKKAALQMGLHFRDYCLRYEQTEHPKNLNINSISKHTDCNKVPFTFSQSPIFSFLVHIYSSLLGNSITYLELGVF